MIIVQLTDKNLDFRHDQKRYNRQLSLWPKVSRGLFTYWKASKMESFEKYSL